MTVFHVPSLPAFRMVAAYNDERLPDQPRDEFSLDGKSVAHAR